VNVRSTDNPDDLRPLLAQWNEKLNGAYFGFDITLDKGMQDLHWWTETFQHALFLAEDDDGQAIGLMAVFAVQNHMATKPIAIEKYWFGAGGMQLYLAAKAWAVENGCGHFIASASHLAGGRHDRVAALCNKIGMKHFETTFITEV